jgi:hypothetical protein
MKTNKWDKLREDFPLLYYRETFFEVPDNWYDVIADLSAKLEVQIKIYAKDNPEASHDNDDDGLPHAVQVKSKFGGLRFYMSFQTEKMDDLIRQAENDIWSIKQLGTTS